jgi:hypothetical protein
VGDFLLPLTLWPLFNGDKGNVGGGSVTMYLMAQVPLAGNGPRTGTWMYASVMKLQNTDVHLLST